MQNRINYVSFFANRKYTNPIVNNIEPIKANHAKELSIPVNSAMKKIIEFRNVATNTPDNIARSNLSEFLDIHKTAAKPTNTAPRRLDIIIPLSSGINPKLDNAFSGKIKLPKPAIKNIIDAMNKS